MDGSQFDVSWRESGHGLLAPFNPSYPRGSQIDLTLGGALQGCVAALPYPALGVGYYRVTCNQCSATVSVRATGRADDPFSVRIACKKPR